MEALITNGMGHPTFDGGTLGSGAPSSVPDPFSSLYLALTLLQSSSDPITSLTRFVNRLAGV